MQSRATRFWLRFDSGPRQGETVPLAEGTLSVGRRSANKIVLADGSISGFHAELHVGASKVDVVDLGSTNGTRLGSTKIERSAAAHGDSITFGSINATLLDQEFLGASGSEQSPPGNVSQGLGAPGGAAAEQGLDRVGEQGLAAAGRRGFLAPLLLILAVGGGGAALYFLKAKAQAAEDASNVSEVPGNLIADSSFEAAGASDWVSSDTSTETFFSDASFAASGTLGFGVILDAEETTEEEANGVPWSFCSGPELRVFSGKGLDLSVSAQAGEGTVARVGLAFSAARGDVAPFIAWAQGLFSGTDFSKVSLLAAVPPGYDHVAVALAARGEGWAAFDDVILLAAEAPAPLVTGESLEVHGFGPGGATVTLVRSGRVVFPSIAFGAWGPTGLRGSSAGNWSASGTDGGQTGHLSLTSTGLESDATLYFSMQGAAPVGGASSGETENEGSAFISSLGPDGYRSHALSFDVPAITDLLLGRGFDLIRVGFDHPVAATGRVRDGLLRFSVAGVARASSATFSLQSSFADERAMARQLQGQAEAAERNGNTGQALGLWQRLLDEVPFEAQSAKRAETERARLIQEGLEGVEAVRKEIERAEFFGLADLYSQSLQKAQVIATSYRGTEVAPEAEEVAQQVERALAQLGLDQHQTSERIGGVLQAINSDQTPRLGEYVHAALEEAKAMEHKSTGFPAGAEPGSQQPTQFDSDLEGHEDHD